MQDVPLSGYRPFIEAEPADPTCAVQASVYLTEQTFDALALSKPTASPVPTTVLGDIVFDITNYLPTAIEVGTSVHFPTLPAWSSCQRQFAQSK